MKKDPLKSYTSFLDRIVKFITDGDKLKTFIIEKKRKLFYISLLLIILSTSFGVWRRGECLNCKPLTQEEAIFYKQNPAEIAKLAESKLFGPYTSLEKYFTDLILPISINLVGYILVISILYIVFTVIKRVLLRYKVNSNTTINLDKLFKKDD